jgi:DNA-binding transcriptional LysR family regulator
MLRENMTDLMAFIAVAQARSFTRAAAKLGVSQSALSHTIRGLEERLGLRLLTRTTRSVTPTEVGERLLAQVAPRLEEVEAELTSLRELRDKPAGTIRISAIDYVINAVLLPKLASVIQAYPDIKIETIVDYGLLDIVADRFDIGVRDGDQVAKDMIAVRIAPDYRLAIVGAPSYLQGRPAPKTPADLARHNCICLRLPTQGGIYAWELQKGRRKLQVKVDGQLTCNGVYQMLNAALSGAGLAFMPEGLAQPYVDAGQLQWVLEDWYQTFPGFHLYYPSRRQSSRALAVVVEALRYRA